MARENVSFTRYYYKVIIGGGGGGGRIYVYTKKHGRTTRAAWDRMLYQDVQIVAIPPKNLRSNYWIWKISWEPQQIEQ